MKPVFGVVVSNKMMKSIVVAVDRVRRHPKYRKYIKRTSKFMAHDEENTCNMGDRVKIFPSRKLSKRKCWVLSEVMRRAPVMEMPTAAAKLAEQDESEVTAALEKLKLEVAAARTQAVEGCQQTGGPSQES